VSTEDNKALVRRGIEQCLNNGKMAVADEIFTSDFVFHTPAQPEPFHGPAGFKQYVTTIRTAFPDIHFTIHNLLAEGDLVAARWSATLSHRGEFFGIPPTGNEATLTGIHVYRISGDRIAEEWQELSALRLIQDLGVLPPVEKMPRPVLKILIGLQGLLSGKKKKKATPGHP
jgi:steroid delta-isomerase-like uncharacterized protein